MNKKIKIQNNKWNISILKNRNKRSIIVKFARLIIKMAVNILDKSIEMDTGHTIKKMDQYIQEIGKTI